MIDLNYIDMPDEFTRLLRVDMSTSSRYHVDLQTYILSNPSLKGIVNRILSNGEDVDVHSFMKKLGWHGIRDRILGYYINLVVNKSHIEKVNFEIIDDILDFEQAFRNFTVSGYSRLLMFGFYLKLDCHEREFDSLLDHPLYPNKNIKKYLLLAQERVVNIDYLIILLHHLILFFGEDKLDSYIMENFSYESLFIKLNQDQKEIISKNYLTYCASIGDKEFFTMKTV